MLGSLRSGGGGMVLRKYLGRRADRGDGGCMLAAWLSFGGDLQGADEPRTGLRSRARVEIVMVVEDGDGGLECWVDPVPGEYPMQSRGRCPGGVNSRTGSVHRVVWAHPLTRIAWEDDDWSLWEAAQNGSQ
jgi:hypothetical protein